MAEHTCIARAPTPLGPCPGCREQFEALVKKEREVLAAVIALVGSDRGGDDGTLMRVGREYAALMKVMRVRFDPLADVRKIVAAASTLPSHVFGVATAPPLHLYEFDQGGYYAALSKESAFELYNADVGDDLAAEDFEREVPDYEEIEVTIELGDKWNDPREYSKPIKPQQGLNGTIDVIWCLKLTAYQWANEQGEPRPGHCFGGDC